MKDFSRGLKLDPNNERYSGAEAYLYMGVIKFEKRQKSSSVGR